MISASLDHVLPPYMADEKRFAYADVVGVENVAREGIVLGLYENSTDDTLRSVALVGGVLRRERMGAGWVSACRRRVAGPGNESRKAATASTVRRPLPSPHLLLPVAN
jgi:hypothetical protein